MPTVTISEAVFERLKRFAEPLEDDVSSTICKVMDLAEQASRGGAPSAKQYDVGAPPSLSFTTVKSVKLAGRTLKQADYYWNKVMFAVIREAIAKGATADAVLKTLPINATDGMKTDNGYHHLEDVGLSVQGQDANGAWKAIHAVAIEFALPLEIVFAWQSNPKVATPNAVGSFVI